MQHNFLGNLILLALVLAPHDANAIKNGTFAFLRLRQLKYGATGLFCHIMPLVSALASHGTIGIDVM